MPDMDNDYILLPVIGESGLLQFIFDKIANLGLNQINHVKNQQNCYLDLLLTNVSDDFCVNEALAPLWRNEVFHTAIDTDFYIDNEFEEVFDFNSANYDNIRNKLNNMNWQSILRSKDDNITNGPMYK